MRWVLSLDGGPRRVNHAAVAIGDKIYSFGGYSANDPLDSQSDFIDIHVLNTFSYRWERLPVFPRADFAEGTKQRSATISTPAGTSGVLFAADIDPSTSAVERRLPSATDVRRRRAISLTEVHPLARIRSANPPLEETEDDPPQREANAIPTQRQRSAPTNRCGDGWRDRPRAVIAEEAEREEAGISSALPGQLSAAFDNNSGSAEVEEEDGDEADDDESSLTLSTIGVDSWESAGQAEEGMETDEDGAEDSDAEMAQLAADHGQVEYEDDEGEEEDNLMDELIILAKLRQHPEVPFKRYGHTVVAYRGAVYLWGGRNDKLGCNQTLHRYDPVSNRWSVVPTQGQCPPSRDGHSATIDGDSMYIFGGFEEREHRFSQETYAFHFPTKVWKKLKTEGEPPQYRDFHAACVLSGKMYVFGGRSDEMGQLHTSHDVYCDKLHCLDLKTHRWHRPEVKEPTTAPCGRRSLTIWSYRDAMYLFGGYQSIQNTHFNDLWRFDPTTSKWTKLLPSGKAPWARRRQCTVLVGDRVFLFGGTMPNSGRKSGLSDLGDLYVLDFAPSLAVLCCQAVLRCGLLRHAENILPSILTRELRYLSTPNRITKSHMPSSDSMTRG